MPEPASAFLQNRVPMNRLRILVLGAVLAMTFVGAVPATAAGPIAFDRTEVSVDVGDRFTLIATLRPEALPGPAIAHLNVVSLTPDVYVDPEDWSSNRTQPVPETSPARLTWPIQAVNAGTFDVYLVLVPTSPTAGAEPLLASAAVRVSVADRRTINAAGALPLVIAMPALIGTFFGLLRWRRHRAARLTTGH
jgi:hypothetical protein